jgi:hypothetical protein
MSDNAALMFISLCNKYSKKNAIYTYGFLDQRHCVLDNGVGSILGVADDDLLAVGSSVGQGHEECDEEEMDGELHVDWLIVIVMVFGTIVFLKGRGLLGDADGRADGVYVLNAAA